jgi:hypothetical protein
MDRIMNTIKLTGLLLGACCLTLTSEAQTWIQTIAPNENWQSIASSADGTKLVAVADNNPASTGNGVIYTSTNSGSTWMSNNAPNLTWNWVASSADGNYLAATVYNGGIYTSTNAGNSWTQSSADISSWWSIASSADGTRLFAGGGEIETSTNAGSTWTRNSAPFTGCTSIACSANGSNLVAGSISSGNVYISSNSGATWKLTTNVTMNTEGWVTVASSADGTRLVASGQATNPFLYFSADAGATWTTNGSPQIIEAGTPYVACSADGSHLAAAVANVGVFFSTNYGGTWSTTGTIPSGTVAFSANAGELVASVYGGGIYTMELPVSPFIYLMQAVEPVLSNLLIGTNYQLQVSPNLSTWTNSGSAFTATNNTMIYPQYFNVANWSQLFFRVQVAP